MKRKFLIQKLIPLSPNNLRKSQKRSNSLLRRKDNAVMGGICFPQSLSLSKIALNSFLFHSRKKETKEKRNVKDNFTAVVFFLIFYATVSPYFSVKIKDVSRKRITVTQFMYSSTKTILNERFKYFFNELFTRKGGGIPGI